AGSVGGYFRDDKFNSADFIQVDPLTGKHPVLPYSNQQVSTTLGGPIKKDRVHFFGAYEFEREPKTYAYSGPYPFFNINQQFTTQSRLSVRVSSYHTIFYAGGGATSHPSVGGTRERTAPEYAGTFTHVLNTRSVNEIKVGLTDYRRLDQPSVRWKGGPFPYHPVRIWNSPVI